jgi:hypothetical protein
MIHPWSVAFRRYGDDVDIILPGYFFDFGSNINSILNLHAGMPPDLGWRILSTAHQALEAFVAQERAEEMLPQTTVKARLLLAELNLLMTKPGANVPLEPLQSHVRVFGTTLTDELQRTHNFVLSDKGNLSVKSLLNEPSRTYPPDVLELIDNSIRREIDGAGKCLACKLNTACGFHALRSVELVIMAFVVAATGALPKTGGRSWGKYIELLEKNKAHSTVVDILRVLKTKRNPLMHPEETLDVHEAINLFCLCESATTALARDVKRKNLDASFRKALEDLPELARADRLVP